MKTRNTHTTIACRVANGSVLVFVATGKWRIMLTSFLLNTKFIRADGFRCLNIAFISLKCFHITALSTATYRVFQFMSDLFWGHVSCQKM
jgi:hypothetical protein